MGVPADWYLDPTSRNERRYWDGARWTDRVIDANGNETVDSLAQGRAMVDVGAWARADADHAGGSVASSTRVRRVESSGPDARHKVIMASSMLTGGLWLALVALVAGLLPLLGPVAIVGGMVTVWSSLIARMLIRGSGDLEVAGPMRNVLLGLLAAIVGAISTALLVAMLRGGEVATFFVCLGQTTEPSQCVSGFVDDAVRRFRW